MKLKFEEMRSPEVADLIKKDGNGFNWNSRMNFTKSEQIVTDQADDQIVYAGFFPLFVRVHPG